MPRLPYSAEAFVLHSGVKRDFIKCLGVMKQPGFRVAFFMAGKGWGKTHLAIRLAHEFAVSGMEPHCIVGSDSALLASSGGTSGKSAVLIVDDAQLYLESLKDRGSGEFVALVEELRRKEAALILLSSLEPGHFHLDEHVLSRLKPGLGFHIEAPLEEDMPELVMAMLNQRGIAVPPRKLEFVIRRMPRELPAITDYLSRVQHLALSCGGVLDYSMLEACL